ncbi:MAG TPA: DnaB-like helicase N-terminal domain-containing protein [Rariglobus sp.]|jgi:hypothetical protein|nr:DnaB-like helicase N-terminal domain-containing protein [Rariglobus sp.]
MSPTPTPSSIGRTPPHSIEAEEYLLSCCFLDGAEVVSKCITAEIVQASFYIPANRVIYGKLVELYNKGTAIDLAILQQELDRSKLIKEIGGYAYLVQISQRIPTTAQADYFISKIRELHQLRDLINTATKAVEGCYTYSGPEDFEKIISPLRTVSDSKTTIGEKMRETMLNFAKPPKEPQPRWLIDHKPVCTPGNLTAIVAQAKSGKTAFIGAFIAAAMAAESERQGVELEGIDTLGVSANPPSDRVLIHIDTEQSPFDHFQTLRRAVARAKLTAAPAWLWSFSMAGWGAADLRRALAESLKRAKRMNLEVFGVILDGVADLCVDVNDAEESNGLIAELHAHAIAANTPIICVVHRNEGEKADSAARGHLGKQLARKAETNLRMEKTDGKTVVFSERNRGAPILEKDGPCFEWSEEKGLHVTAATVGRSRAEANKEELQALAEEVFEGGKQLTYTDAKEAIQKARGCSPRTAERHIKQLKSGGIIIHSGAGKHALKS